MGLYCISAQMAHLVEMSDGLPISVPPTGERKQSFQFTVHTESSWNKRNDYIMAAQNDAEMKAWVAAFKVEMYDTGRDCPLHSFSLLFSWLVRRI